MEIYCRDILEERTSYIYKPTTYAVFGSTIYIKRSLLDILKNKGFNKVLPTNKMQMESLERLWAIVLEQEGYDIKTIGLVENTVFKDNDYFDKFWLDRQ